MMKSQTTKTSTGGGHATPTKGSRGGTATSESASPTQTKAVQVKVREPKMITRKHLVGEISSVKNLPQVIRVKLSPETIETMGLFLNSQPENARAMCSEPPAGFLEGSLAIANGGLSKQKTVEALQSAGIILVTPESFGELEVGQSFNVTSEFAVAYGDREIVAAREYVQANKGRKGALDNFTLTAFVLEGVSTDRAREVISELYRSTEEGGFWATEADSVES